MRIFYYIAYVHHRFFRFLYRKKGNWQSREFEHHHHRMKYFRGLLLIVGIVLFLFTQPIIADQPTEQDKTELAADMLQTSIVKITKMDVTATGFYITPNEIITNHHVTAPSTTIFFTTGNKTCFGDVIYTTEQPDLSLLHTDCTGTPLKIAQSAKVGQTILIMGNPLSTVSFLSKGIISAVSDSFILHDSFTDHGSSGSPMVNLNGEVVGVVYGKFKGADNIGIGVSIQALDQFLKEAR